ncbi:MAG: diacylglycerol kinase [Rubrivivax sp.]|nr:diacylglycerol kinase [Rubrivivax sp.]
MTTPPNPPSGDSAFKSRGGLRRIFNAARYSLAGFRAAFRHEAAFRQELVLGIPMLLLVPFVAPGRWQALLLAGSVVAVWIVELLNSAVEALADTISTEHHPMLGRAKDIGSAAVMLALVFAGVVWTVILWPAK